MALCGSTLYRSFYNPYWHHKHMQLHIHIMSIPIGSDFWLNDNNNDYFSYVTINYHLSASLSFLLSFNQKLPWQEHQWTPQIQLPQLIRRTISDSIAIFQHLCYFCCCLTEKYHNRNTDRHHKYNFMSSCA